MNSIFTFSCELSNFYMKTHRNIRCTAFTGKSIGEISAPEAYSPTWQQQINSRQSWRKQACEWPDSQGGLRSAASIYYGNTVSGKYIPILGAYSTYCTESVLGEWGWTSTCRALVMQLRAPVIGPCVFICFICRRRAAARDWAWFHRVNICWCRLYVTGTIIPH